MLVLLDTNVHSDWSGGRLDPGVEARLGEVLSLPDVDLLVPLVQLGEFRWPLEKRVEWARKVGACSAHVVTSDLDVVAWDVLRFVAEALSEPPPPDPVRSISPEAFAGRLVGIPDDPSREQLHAQHEASLAAHGLSRSASRQRACEARAERQRRRRESRAFVDRYFADPVHAKAMDARAAEVVERDGPAVQAAIDELLEQPQMEACLETLERTAPGLGFDRDWFRRTVLEVLAGRMDGMLRELEERLPDGAAVIRALSADRPVGLDALGVRRWTEFLGHARTRWPVEVVRQAFERLRADPWQCPALEVRVRVGAALESDEGRRDRASDFGDLLLLPWVACVDY